MTRALLRTVLFLLILFLLAEFLIFAARPRRGSGMEMVKRLYEQPGSIDIAVLGQSQVCFGYNAGMLAERLSADVYLLASPGQSVLDSYYLLKEALRQREIGTLFLQINTAWLRPLDRENGEARSVGLLQCMPPSLNRLQYSLDASGRPFFVVELMGVARSQTAVARRIASLNAFRRLFDPERSLRWNPAAGEAFDRGFVARREALSPDETVKPLPSAEAPDPEALSYLDRIMRLCSERGIRVVWVSTPYPPEALAGLGDYDEEYQMVRRMAEAYGVTYWNFNLARREALPLERTDFRDSRHLNLSGANKLTALFADLIAADREGKDVSGIFYESFAQRQGAEN